MPSKAPWHDDDERLLLWLRAFGFVLFSVTMVLAVLAVVLLPLLQQGYHVSEGAVIAILGTLATSALALVNVQVILRRNGK